MSNDKFTESFIIFIETNFDKHEHLFLIVNILPESQYPISMRENIIFLDGSLCKSKNFFKFSRCLIPYFNHASIIIFHGIFTKSIINFLFLNPIFLKKSLWVIWGGDLYYDNKYNSLNPIENFYIFRKKNIISKLHGLITYVKGDYELARKWYGAEGKYYECFMYPSNLYKEYSIQLKTHDTINIQVGNSAFLNNNHIEVFEKLYKFKDENIRIYVPLSYGSSKYAQQVISAGQAMFGDKLIGMTDFMAFNEYLDFLSDIDIAIFNHERQQAMGNKITLLGLGKKVYMRSDITPWETFSAQGIKVFDIENIELFQLDKNIRQQNMIRVKEYFSKDNFVKQLETVFR